MWKEKSINNPKDIFRISHKKSIRSKLMSGLYNETKQTL